MVHIGSTHSAGHRHAGHMEEQNGRHFADDIFKCIFLNQNLCILIKISLKFVPKGLIDNKSSLVQVMAWCCVGEKPLPELMMTQFTDA